MKREDLAKTIGDNIAAERKTAGLQQGALAERIGVAQSSVSKLEQGHGVPSVETLLRISGALGCTLTALLRGVEAKQDAYRQGYEDGWRACAGRAFRATAHVRHPGGTA